MITVFNRREICVTRDMARMNRVREVLAQNRIPYKTHTHNHANPPGRGHSGAFVRADAAYEYHVYVHRTDYEKARYMVGGL